MSLTFVICWIDIIGEFHGLTVPVSRKIQINFRTKDHM